MYWNGKPEFIFLSKDTEIQGYTPKRKRFAHWHVSFYNSGSLSLFSLQNDIEIEGVPCSKDADLRLFPDGRLWECTLSKDFEIEGKLNKTGTHLIFDESGKAYNYSVDKYFEISYGLNIDEFTKRFYRNK